MNILIAEPMAQAGIDLFRAQAGWNVIVSNPKGYGAAPRRSRSAGGAQRRAGDRRRAQKKRAPKPRVIGTRRGGRG